MGMTWPPEWTSISDAACADFASQQRLQAMIVSAMLCISDEKLVAEDRATERRLQVRFDDLNRVGIILASLLKAGGV